jgi:hypothetical protein
MKIIRFSALLIILFSCNSIEKNKTTFYEFFKNDIYKGDFIPYDTILIDLNDNKTLDSIFLFKEKKWNDPGDFQKMVISFDNKTKMVFYNTGDWIGKPKFKKISNSKSLLFIDGYAYASSPQTYTIIDIDELNPRIVFKNHLEIVEIKDLNNDGINEIIGFEYYSECYKDYDSISSICSYAPFYVYEYSNDTLALNEGLTEEYNLENYVGYFGLYDKNNRYEIVIPNFNYREKNKPYFLNMIGRKLPESSLRPLKEEELLNYTKAELRIIRNEIYAFHGYIFDSQDLVEYFDSQNWYKPISKEVIENLNKYEKQNIDLILKLENK